MTRRISRHLAVLGTLGAALLLTATTATARSGTQDRAAASAGSHASGPVGVWEGAVAIPGGEVEATMSFRSDGTLCLVAPPPGPDGGVEGAGRWVSTGQNTFSFRVTERFFDGTGATTGYLRASHSAVVHAGRFSSSGTGAFYDAGWTLLDSFTATSRMHRTSPVPTAC
ncbi:hypothetical protein [Streptomyces liangshanensis]|uniref:Uncharacterized protein n=1 Tax=Streptomyces liangshanensis TaxID=2717324 RepID=A0A6G9GUB4_9ACTN|nr:hypothetical protein [Streptomyces liangshanensis]QIQ01848.1 hypothetical protein HA039_05685 [Streptomyces liangshanensis]